MVYMVGLCLTRALRLGYCPCWMDVLAQGSCQQLSVISDNRKRPCICSLELLPCITYGVNALYITSILRAAISDHQLSAIQVNAPIVHMTQSEQN